MSDLAVTDTHNDARALRVVVCDPYEFSRTAISALLRTELDLCVVGEYCTAEAALFDSDSLMPDIAVINPLHVDVDSLRICTAFSATTAHTSCIVLAAMGDDDTHAAAARVGAELLLKTSSMNHLAPAIRQIAGRVCA